MKAAGIQLIYNSGPGLKNDVLNTTDERFLYADGKQNSKRNLNYMNKLSVWL